MYVRNALYNYVSAVAPLSLSSQVIGNYDSGLPIASISSGGTVTLNSTHSLQRGDYVTILETSNTQINNTVANPYYTVVNVLSPTSFSIQVNSSASGGIAIPAYIGAVDTTLYPRIKLISLFNLARKAVYNELMKEDVHQLRGFVKSATLTPSYVGGNTQYTKPIDYHTGISLKAVDYIDIISYTMAPLYFKEWGDVYKHTSGSLIAFETNNVFILPGINYSNNALLYYYSYSDIGITDIWNNTNDGFSQSAEYRIIEKAIELTKQ